MKMAKQDVSPDAPAHTPGTGKGDEKAANEGKEPGRFDKGGSGADRPAGGSTARSSTSINPEAKDSIDLPIEQADRWS